MYQTNKKAQISNLVHKVLRNSFFYGEHSIIPKQTHLELEKLIVVCAKTWYQLGKLGKIVDFFWAFFYAV